jgi:cation diffusion facilitator CzcD-associated flavoprotein CzcO/acetyl esterase/lipase
MNGGVFRTPRSVRITPGALGGVPGEWVETGASKSILLYLHGGGYFACSAKTHRPATTEFAKLGFRVYAPDYRLAPEHLFPAAIDDAVAAYRALRSEAGAGAPIFIAGDSAGGGLALATMLKLRGEGDELPAAAALFSPLTVLDGQGGSRVANDKRCAMFYGEGLQRATEYYLGGQDPKNPLASPLYADLAGLPPLLIHVGADETLLDDSTLLAAKARAAGVPVEFHVWPAVPHVWQLFHQLVPEGRESLKRAADFLHRTTARDVDVAIIGSGFAGLGMAIQLRKAGMDSFVILEKSGEIGGTWRDNTYPGCACDIPSHLYSFSFESNPEWTRLFPTQPEIWDYLRRTVDKYHLKPSIRFHSEVREAAFDEGAHLWRLRLGDGSAITARTVVAGMGPLNRPAYPLLRCAERFQGPSFHSAVWDHSVDLRGKRVAVIGTGASAIQFVPEIAPNVAALHLFQRAPPWVAPKLDRPIRDWERFLFRRLPGYTWLFRNFLYWQREWAAYGFTRNPKVMKLIEGFGRKNIASAIQDPDLRERVTPTYTAGCKRILISNDYYPALTRPNVELVTNGIAEVTERGIVTEDGKERPVDVLIYGTGFLATDYPGPIRITGRNGVDLRDAWREGMEAYYGITVAGYPNLFLLVGPNTGLGHNSIVFMIEAQVHYVMECLKLMREKGVTEMEVRPEVQAEFNRELQRRMKRTVWVSGCKSWYQDPNGKNTTLWPGFTVGYWRKTREAGASDYRFRVVG